ncbi:site-specific integrase [Photobacterium sanguinicancri]|uniref:site-specific integrase n=1 Tax=Photobacterium sanguinicancri TaxID=875932 RepID=UPI000788F0DA|nr:site-specific integrase [Photobacterium sanguinicancri]KXI21085.1 hypothetical protein AS132_20630 [Photobacterium sanguinicancri]
MEESANFIKYQDLGSDLIIVEVMVPRYPVLKPEVCKETGEIVFTVAARKGKKGEEVYSMLPMIVNSDGVPLLLENLFLRYKMTRVKEDSLRRTANALLTFCRFTAASTWFNDLDQEEQMTFRSLTSNPELGAPWLFGDFMFDHLRKLDPSTGIVIEDGYAPSTSKLSIRTTASFYKWLIESEYIRVSSDYLPYNKKSIELTFSNKSTDMLSHTGNGMKCTIETSDLVQRFTNASELNDVPAWQKLKPMTPLHRVIFENELAKKEGSAKSLMYELGLDAGLRVRELVTFPESEVRQPRVHEDVIKVTISEARNGCKTKFDKQRTIEISREMMEKLWEYKVSDKRLNALSADYELDIPEDNKPATGKETFNQLGEESHGRLFISERSSDPITTNTLQHYLSKIRQYINENYDKCRAIAEERDFDLADDVANYHEKEESCRHELVPSWYYRPHDARSTFATRWLIREHVKRQLPLEMLLDDLRQLMGHQNVDQTRKYTKFLDQKLIKFKSASSRNMHASMLY